jgi:hypothetical protein
MADGGLFIGWGASITGREAKGLEVFNEALQYYGRLQQDGRIKSFDVGLLEPHGGDLNGFILLRGDREQLNQLHLDEEFERLTTRASLIVERIGVVNVATGDDLQRAIGVYQQAIGDVT